MNLLEAMQARHSVRSYENRAIEDDITQALQKEIDICNKKAGLSMQLIVNDDTVFKGMMAHYGGFRGVSNYIALVAKDCEEAQEWLGYYGEHIVLKAQQLGLNTCWVALTYKKGRCAAVVKEDEKLVCVIAIGYGTTQGNVHKSKNIKDVYQANKELPAWFEKGIAAALLAPTAMNKQNFRFILHEDEHVTLEMKESKYSNVDAGIVRYHFETGAGRSL